MFLYSGRKHRHRSQTDMTTFLGVFLLFFFKRIITYCAFKPDTNASVMVWPLSPKLNERDGLTKLYFYGKMYYLSSIRWPHLYLTACGKNWLFFYKLHRKPKQNCFFQTWLTRQNNRKRKANIREWKGVWESAFITGNDSSLHVSSLQLENKSMKTNHTFANNAVCGECDGGLNKSQSK